MKKKNTAKKAVLPALLAVLCSTAALTSVSYAWFTMGNTASVDDIELNVQAADGVQVSVDAVNWKSVISYADLKTVSTNLLPTEDDESTSDNDETSVIRPVSTIGEFSEGKQSMFLGDIQSDGGITATALSETSGFTHYVAFDLYVQLDSDQPFYLSKGSYVTSEGDIQSHLASRVSFLNLGNTTSSTPADAKNLGTTVEGEAKGNVSGTATIWEPNALNHLAKQVQQGKAVEGEADTSFLGVKSAISYVDGAKPEGYDACFSAVDTLKPEYDSNFVTTAEAKLFDLKQGVNKLRVYIWLEGQDVDCINDIADGMFNTGLKFNIPAKENNA